jgi:hypothetical protein
MSFAMLCPRTCTNVVDASFFLRYSRFKEVRDAREVAIAEMQRIGFILKKVAAKHSVCAGDPVSAGMMSNACSMMQEIADIIDTNSLKLQEALDGPSTPSNYSNYMNVDCAWFEENGIDLGECHM